jgi:rubrerythrin
MAGGEGDDAQRALDVLRRAIQSEIAGHRFYSDAARYCVDPWAKEVFFDLARDEDEHARLLIVEYESLAAGGRWIGREAAAVAAEEADITRLTFPGEAMGSDLFLFQGSVRETVDRRSDDLAALAYGIGLEKQAIDLYRKAADQAREQTAREAYEFLVQEELGHHDRLRQQWEALAGRAYAP